MWEEKSYVGTAALGCPRSAAPLFLCALSALYGYRFTS